MRRVLLATTLAALLVPAAPAAASKLTFANGTLTFTEEVPGANNNVTLSGISGVTVSVSGADTITPPVPPNCNEGSPGTNYLCTGVSSVVVDVRAGNDTVIATGLAFPTSISGGDGDDMLDGGSAADVINGGAGNDDIAGGPGSDQLTGGDGSDTIAGGADADTLDGGAGNDGVGGGSGNDVLNGGGENDNMNGDDGDDTVNGGPGDDFTVNGGAGNDKVNGQDGDDSLEDGGGSDALSGGPGIDHVTLSTRPTVSVTLDGLANDGAPGESANVLADVEDVTVDTPADGSATLVGSDAGNILDADGGAANINGLGGADTIYGTARNDTITARDGFPDRVYCFEGADTAFVDTLDTVSSSCENVQVAAVPGPAGLDDRPPTVTWSTPASAASFRGDVATPLTVTATDDRGVAKVQFFDEERLLCEDTAAPYTCSYQARGADIGRNTLIAVATDTAGQATTAIRLVMVDRFRPSVSLSLKPSRDKRPPYRFKAGGTLTKAGACSGSVVVTAKAGKRTISARRAKVSSKCRYSVAMSFRSRVRPRLKFSARFEGNSSTVARSSSSKTARLG